MIDLSEYESLDDSQLMKRTMNLEFKLQDAMRRERSYGRGSTTSTLHNLCHELWKLIDRRQRHLKAFGIPLPKKKLPPASAALKPKLRVLTPYG